MFIPDGFTEEEVLKTIDVVVSRLAAPFKFGFHETNDMKQEGRLFAMQALKDFDPARGSLPVFLTNHIRNRFINMKRDKFGRQHPPCSFCPFYKYQFDKCIAFGCQEDCDKWRGWKTRNTTKRNLIEGYNPNNVVDSLGSCEHNSTTNLEQMSNKEIIVYVNQHLPVSFRADYCRILNGVKISKIKRERIFAMVKKLVGEKFHGET